MVKVIEPYYIIEDELDGINICRRLEKAGRTCYKSEGNITEDSYKVFLKKIIDSGHHSVIEHEKVTVRIICDRGILAELTRHRLASFSVESTRYSNYSKERFGKEITVIEPPELDEVNKISWFSAMKDAEDHYFALLSHGVTPQIARGVLPNSLKTEIVITANLREWRTIFKQRTSKAAHPQMRQIMIPLLAEFKQKIPIIFDDL